MKKANPSSLSQALDDAAAIKRDMLELLIDLETKATAKTPVRPGIWRHHPVQWAKDNSAR